MDLDTVELEDLLPPSLKARMKYYQWIVNSYPKIIDNDGKQELIGLRLTLHDVEEVSLLRGQRIIKLTWQHYLGIEVQTCRLFVYEYGKIKLLAVFQIDGKITLDKVMDTIEEVDLEAYGNLTKFLARDARGENYVSHYRCFEAVFSGDIFVTVATLRVTISNNFVKTFLDVVGELVRQSGNEWL